MYCFYYNIEEEFKTFVSVLIIFPILYVLWNPVVAVIWSNNYCSIKQAQVNQIFISLFSVFISMNQEINHPNKAANFGLFTRITKNKLKKIK